MPETEARTVRERIQLLSKDFTKADNRIAGAILSDYPMAGLQTLVDLGKTATSSPATILRFVSKLGFSGFPELQKALREELQSTLDSPLSRLQNSEHFSDAGSPLTQYAGYANGLIQDTIDMVSLREFDQVLEVLADTKRPVHLIGGRYSRSLAELFCYSLSSLRPGIHTVSDDSRAMVEVLAGLSKRNVVVAFDFRRYQTNIENFVREAAATGAMIILFTDRWRSPAARHAHHVLSLPVASPSLFDTGLSALLCIEAFAAALAEKLGPAGKDHVARIDALYHGMGTTQGHDAESL